MSTKAKVLIVDDDESIRRSLKRKLIRKYVVHTCKDANEALEAINQFSFQSAIIDYQMPEMGGLTLLEKIKEDHDIPVIIISGVVSPQESAAAIKNGAYDFIVKDSPEYRGRNLIRRIRDSIRESDPLIQEAKLRKEFSKAANGSLDYLVETFHAKLADLNYVDEEDIRCKRSESLYLSKIIKAIKNNKVDDVIRFIKRKIRASPLKEMIAQNMWNNLYISLNETLLGFVIGRYKNSKKDKFLLYVTNAMNNCFTEINQHLDKNPQLTIPYRHSPTQSRVIVKSKNNTTYLIIGSSGSGKTTLAKAAAQSIAGTKRIVTTTTRDMRQGEVQGHDHNFVTNDEFNKLKDKGMFVHTYTKYGIDIGIPKEVIKHLEGGLDPLIVFNIGIEEIATLRNNPIFANAIPIYMATDNYKERILSRDPNIAKNELNKRLKTAEASIEDYKTHHELIKYLIFSSFPGPTSSEGPQWMLGVNKSIKQLERILNMERTHDSKNTTFEAYHNMYINRWVKQFTGYEIPELEERLSKGSEVTFSLPNEYLTNYINAKNLTPSLRDYVNQVIEKYFPKRVIAALNSYTTFNLLLEPPIIASTLEIPGEKRIINNVLRMSEGFVLASLDIPDYRPISRQGLIKTDDDSTIDDGSLLSLTELYYPVEFHQPGIRALHIGFIRDATDQTKVTQLPRDQLSKIRDRVSKILTQPESMRYS